MNNPIEHTLLATTYDLGVHRAGRWVIHGVDLEVHQGEILTLIGPNGSGKSTTVKALLGLIPPDEGTAGLEPGVKVGYVPQRFSVDHSLPLTVHRLMTLTMRASRETCLKTLQEVGADHLIDRPVKSLSGGETQRVLIARALIRDPDLLVLDEPVQGVDFSGEIALYDLIRSIRDERGCGVVLVSHDLHIVMGSTDKVICLNGHVCCSGPPQQVSLDPEYKRLFGAKAADALAVYHHQHDHEHLPDGRVVPEDKADA